MSPKHNLIIFNFIIFLSFISFINCDEQQQQKQISQNKFNLIISSYQNNVLKKFGEVIEFKTPGTVSRFNILYNIKRYMMKLDKKKIERNIEKIKKAKENPSYKINEFKLAEEITQKEKTFIKDYRQLLKIIRDTNNLYKKFIQFLKKIFIISISIVIFCTILAIGIIIYITSPKCKKYNILINEKEKDGNNDNNTDDNSSFKIVKIFNRFMKSDQKIQ